MQTSVLGVHSSAKCFKLFCWSKFYCAWSFIVIVNKRKKQWVYLDVWCKIDQYMRTHNQIFTFRRKKFHRHSSSHFYSADSCLIGPVLFKIPYYLVADCLDVLFYCPYIQSLTWCISSKDPCSESKKEGPCKAAIDRYYFNSETKKCEKFKWGGCYANGNNFQSKDSCTEICGKS